MRPAWHYRPEKNWINDPNGLVQYKGWYHMFFQLNPYGDHWANMHWGHARSRDLLTWETLPIAMAPRNDMEEYHCYSGGCCKDAEGKPHFFYTSICWDSRDGAKQWTAEPTDDDLTQLIQTDRYEMTDAIHGDMHVRDWRDPCVVPYKGQYLMVLGGSVDGRGCILLYTSRDMRSWTYRHILAISDVADNLPWECPNIFFLGDTVGLIYSPCAEVHVKIGTLDETLRFHEISDEVFDPSAKDGFYAPQTFRDDAGRVIMIAWMPECDGGVSKGWSGVMSLPRVLSMDADGLHAAPLPGVEKFPGVRCLSVARDALPATWVLHENADGTEKTLLTLAADGRLFLDRSQSSVNPIPSKKPLSRQVPLRDENEVFIAVDGSAVECAVNGRWISARIYPQNP